MAWIRRRWLADSIVISAGEGNAAGTETGNQSGSDSQREKLESPETDTGENRVQQTSSASTDVYHIAETSTHTECGLEEQEMCMDALGEFRPCFNSPGISSVNQCLWVENQLSSAENKIHMEKTEGPEGGEGGCTLERERTSF